MSQLYARVFTQILDSSLAEDWQTRHVFEDLLKLADGGIVDMTREAIARRTNVPIDIINRAISVLESPDPASRDASEDGRRLVRLDDHRNWGWIITNWDKYERIKRAEDQRQKTAERTRRWRDRKKVSPAPLPKAASESESEAEAEAASQKRHAASHSVTSSQTEQPGRAAKAAPASDTEWIKTLRDDPAYHGIDVEREYQKMVRWCEANQKQPTRRRFINWLNRVDRPMTTPPKITSSAPLPRHVTGRLA